MNDTAILRRLATGEGVEDIAVQSGIPVDAIRAAVKRLRKAGELAKLWPAP